MRWPIGIAIGFVILFILDFTFAWLAFQGQEPTVTSYTEETR